MRFKVGDRVKILRKVRTHAQGWQNSWVPYMDEAVGKIGTVVYIHEGKHDVQVQVAGVPDIWGYPAFVLRKVRQASTTNKSKAKVKKRK
jgi:hypothetical protein